MDEWNQWPQEMWLGGQSAPYVDVWASPVPGAWALVAVGVAFVVAVCLFLFFDRKGG